MHKLATSACVVLLFVLLGIAGRVDYDDRKAESAHKAEIKRLAEQEECEKKREYNRLAFEAYLKTGIDGRMK